MAKGLALPIKANKKGGARTLSASPYTEQVIKIGLTPNTSLNPFQVGNGVDLGISEKYVFATNTVAATAGIRRQIINFFARIRAEEIAKLAPGINGLKIDNTGERLRVDIQYIELEADREAEFSTDLRDPLRSNPKVNSGGV